jgi:pantothenate kinase-related protein Tda10
VFSFGDDELKAANAQQDAMDRACPKELRAPPLLIGVAGGTASGKTTVCENIQKSMADDRVVILSMDNFYKPLTDEQKENVNGVPHSLLKPWIVYGLKDASPNRKYRLVEG